LKAGLGKKRRNRRYLQKWFNRTCLSKFLWTSSRSCSF